jgi:Spy/CpxP family protein refolding chaperone
MKRHTVLFVLIMVFLLGLSAQAQDPGQRGDGTQPLVGNDILNLISVLQRSGGQGAGVNANTGLGISTPFGLSPNNAAWWTNAELVARLGLSEDQKIRIERAFQNHRPNLTSWSRELERAEAQLARLLDADVIDRGSVTAQIQVVVQARGEMEKANALMTLDMREVLTRPQWLQLQSLQAFGAGAAAGRGARQGGTRGLGGAGDAGGLGAGGAGAPGARGARGQ